MEEESKASEGNWKAVGNKHFEAMQYKEALQAYTKGLEENSGEINLLSNRGATYLKLELYEDALKDCESVLLRDSSHFKAIYRKTRALCSLEKFHDAKAFVEVEISKIQDDTNKRLLFEASQKIDSLIQQKEHGNFHMPTFMKNPGTHFTEVATFVGPVIISRSRAYHGRGLFAIEDIKPGQLVIAEKAFAVQFKETTNFKKLVAEIGNRLISQPELIKKIYNLYPGPDHEIIEDEKLSKCAQEKADMDRIKAICKYNCFGGAARPQFTLVNSLDTIGLWIMPSYLNHDCIDCNCSWKIFGNIIFIRASKKIKCGEELLISYCDSTFAFHERLELCKQLGFVCNCRLCVVEQNELLSVADERKKLLDEFNNLMQSSFASLPFKELSGPEDLISRIEDLRSEKDMNQFLSTTYSMLGFQYQESGNFDRSIVMLQKAFECVKHLPMADTQLLFCAAIAIAYFINGVSDLGKQWIEILKKELKVVYGSDASEIMECIDPDFVAGLASEGIEF